MSYRQLGTTTSPVVSNLVREDLTSHVKTWPADILAKQVEFIIIDTIIINSILYLLIPFLINGLLFNFRHKS